MGCMPQSKWKCKCIALEGLAERRRSKNKVENNALRSTKAAGVFTTSKSKNALAYLPKAHMGLTHAQSMYLLPWLASPPTAGAIAQIPKPLLTDTHPKIGI
jgi:hypothetical protein